MGTTCLLSVEDVERMGSAGERLELIDGVPREKPGEGLRHGEVAVAVLTPLWQHVEATGLGRVYPSPTRFTLRRDPDTVVIPDLAFVRADHLPPEAERWGIARDAPDLVGEVISPDDRYADVMEKVDRYLGAGVPLVWLVVEPAVRAVIVHRLGEAPATLREGDVLDGGEVVPGFRLPVAKNFT